MLLICSVSIYRLSASIAANLFKKKQFLIKTVNIAYVDFRFVKKNVMCFHLLGSLQIVIGLNSSVCDILLYSVLGKPIRETCCVFNQSEARQTPNIRTFSRAYCHQYVSRSFYDWHISYLKFLIDLLRYYHFLRQTRCVINCKLCFIKKTCCMTQFVRKCALFMAVHRFFFSFQPGCMYRVRVKTGDSNPHIERASPSFIDIQVKWLLMAYVQ